MPSAESARRMGLISCGRHGFCPPPTRPPPTRPPRPIRRAFDGGYEESAAEKAGKHREITGAGGWDADSSFFRRAGLCRSRKPGPRNRKPPNPPPPPPPPPLCHQISTVCFLFKQATPTQIPHQKAASPGGLSPPISLPPSALRCGKFSRPGCSGFSRWFCLRG